MVVAARREEEKSRPNNKTLRGSFVIKLAGCPLPTTTMVGGSFVDEKLFVRQITHTRVFSRRTIIIHFLPMSLSSRDIYKEQVALVVTTDYALPIMLSLPT